MLKQPADLLPSGLGAVRRLRTQPREIAAVGETLLSYSVLTLQDSDVVTAALVEFRKRPAVSFFRLSPRELARKAGHLPLGTFDRDLSKLDGDEDL